MVAPADPQKMHLTGQLKRAKYVPEPAEYNFIPFLRMRLTQS